MKMKVYDQDNEVVVAILDNNGNIEGELVMSIDEAKALHADLVEAIAMANFSAGNTDVVYGG